MKEFNKKNIFIAVIIGIMIILSYKIIAPYLITLISAFLFSYLLYPLYKKLNQKLGSTSSALICIFGTFFIILLFLTLIVSQVTKQAIYLKNNPNLEDGVQAQLFALLEKTISMDTQEIMKEIGGYLMNIATAFALKAPGMALKILIMLIGIFYILTNWEALLEYLKRYIPFKREKREKISQELDRKTKAIFYGSIFMGLIEAFIGFIGFELLGIKIAVLLGLLLFLLAFIPGGPSIVWVPTLIYFILEGNVLFAIFTLILGLILSYGIDAILRAKIVGEQAKINPFIFIIGMVGGISVFGVFGFILGPLLLIYTLEVLEEFLD